MSVRRYNNITMDGMIEVTNITTKVLSCGFLQWWIS